MLYTTQEKMHVNTGLDGHHAPTSAIALSAHPFVSVVGPLQAWSHYGHKRAGGWHRCGRRQCLSRRDFSCAKEKSVQYSLMIRQAIFTYIDRLV